MVKLSSWKIWYNMLIKLLVIFNLNSKLIILFCLDQNKCLPKPCQNGGTFNNNGCITCTCADEYTGARCEIGKYIPHPPYLTLKQQIYESVNM